MFVSMTSSKIGLFSTIVAAFIIEFYKKLSPDSGSQTVALLGQISQQLANSTNGTFSITANQPSPSSASMIWANAMWLMSLVYSLASGLIVMLLQQWARRYVEMPNVPNKPNHRARVRWFLFLGTKPYQMRIVSLAAYSLLHISVILFFAGLVIAFHTINKNVAIVVDYSVGFFGLAYIILTILPLLDFGCPYRTPFSNILWYTSHAILSSAALGLRWSLEQLHGCLVLPGLDGGWLESLENAFKTHWRYFTDGPRKSIIDSGISMQGDVDHKMVTDVFNRLALRDESKFRKFAASIPRERVLDLLRPNESGNIVVREPLRILLQSCAVGTSVAGHEEDVRKRSLLVCLDTINHIAKAPIGPDLNYALVNFANIGIMRALWDESDTAIRVTSRSICALLARQVFRGPFEEPQLRWLHEITGEPSDAIYNADDGTRNYMNLKSFVYGVFSIQVDDLQPEDAMSFKETLKILLDVGNANAWGLDTNFQNRLSEEVVRIQQDDPDGSRDVVDKLRVVFPFLPADPFPTPHAVYY
jgi:hypothetical protein